MMACELVLNPLDKFGFVLSIYCLGRGGMGYAQLSVQPFIS